MNWSEGYVADAEYTSHYFAELAPAHLDLAALTAGVMPPERADGQFRYCELGCGNGMTTNIIAACHPGAEFVGIDFMPVHVANAKRAARRGGLENVQFYELSFADACKENLGQFDYIVAHGVYSWISPQARGELIEFCRRFLAPGGLVYLSYNTYPGWLGISPVQKVVNEIAKTVQGPSAKRTKIGFEFATRLHALKVAAFELNPAAGIQIEKSGTQPPNYLAQEYLNESWFPLYVTDVMREVKPAKLEYVASATLAENDLRFLVNDDIAAMIREQPIEELRQLVKDIAINARFRRDIYSKGGRRLSGLDQRQLLKDRRFGLIRSPDPQKYHISYLGRTLGFDTPAAHAMVDSLMSGPKSLSMLAELAKDAQDPLRIALEVATILCIGGWAQPVDIDQGAHLNMNRALTESALEDTACNAVASRLGAGVLVTPIEMAMLADPEGFKGLDEGITRVIAIADAKGRKFTPKGVTAAGAELHAYLSEEVGKALKRADAFRHFGLI